MTISRYRQYSRDQRAAFWRRATPAHAQEMWLRLTDRLSGEVHLLARQAGVDVTAALPVPVQTKPLLLRFSSTSQVRQLLSKRLVRLVIPHRHMSPIDCCVLPLTLLPFLAATRSSVFSFHRCVLIGVPLHLCSLKVTQDCTRMMPLFFVNVSVSATINPCTAAAFE